jgi:tripartite-type tricarboxylate transporter receptor subunit TctC
MKLSIKSLLLAGLAAVFATGAAAQTAANYPSKPIRIIVPYSPGGTTDMLARVIGKHLQEKWGQPVVVENRPGVNGMLGSDIVAKAAPDGHTFGVASPGSHAANPFLYKNISHDIVKDFTPITLAVYAPLLLIANPDLKVNNVRELLAAAKAKPGEVIYASGGSGSSQHLAMEQFSMMAGVKLQHTPYKGSSAAYPDLLGGRTLLMFDVMTAAVPHVKSGKLKVLATATAQRLPFLPDVPTVAESGVPGFEAAAWYGFVGPAGIPRDVLAKLHGEIVNAMKQPDIKATIDKSGVVIVANSPEEFGAFIKSEMDKAKKVIESANIKMD